LSNCGATTVFVENTPEINRLQKPVFSRVKQLAVRGGSVGSADAARLAGISTTVRSADVRRPTARYCCCAVLHGVGAATTCRLDVRPIGTSGRVFNHLAGAPNHANPRNAVYMRHAAPALH